MAFIRNVAPGSAVLMGPGEDVSWEPPTPKELAGEVARHMAEFYRGFEDGVRNHDILESLAYPMTVEYGRRILAALAEVPVIRLRKED